MARSATASPAGRGSARPSGTSKGGRNRSRKPTGTAAKASKGVAKEPSALRLIVRTHASDLWAVGLLSASVVVALAVYGGAAGTFGRIVSDLLGDLIGWMRYLVAPLAFAGGVLVVIGSWRPSRQRLLIGVIGGVLSMTGLADLAGGSPGFSAPLNVLKGAGGYLGLLLGRGLSAGIGEAAAVIVLLAIFVLASAVISGMTVSAMGKGVFASYSRRQQRRREVREALLSEEETDNWVHDTAEVPAVGSIAGATPGALPAPWGDAFDPDEETPRHVQPVTQLIESVDSTHTEVEQTSDYENYDDEEDLLDVDDDLHEVDETTGEILADAAPTPSPRRAPSSSKKPAANSSTWKLPPSSLLSRTKAQKVDERQIDEMGHALVTALSAHGVETTLVGRTVGPTVARYELELGPGVKVARVTSLSKDIAYAMASPDVRILAPIPGRSAIGVEVPNRQRQLVSLGDILTSPEAEEAKRPLDVALGRDIAGRAVMVDLAEMPHVLISGATGAGKSSCINSLITSVLMRSTPDEVRLMLIDPKRVELGQYNGLPHLLTPVVVDPKKAANALAWAVKEMERRYDLLSDYGVRDITSYTQSLERGELGRRGGPSVRAQVAAVATAASSQAEAYEDEGPERLPYILVVVDELNDLMMVAARDVEDSVCRIAQMARAVGIHLVLATQRPSVDVITGVIKANIPSRMAFSVSSLADSRVILDQPGAERLVGKGDMLLLSAASNVPRRLQAPWVSEAEVRSVVQFWQRQGGQVEETVAISSFVEAPAGSLFSDGDDDDALLDAARRLVVEHQLGSTSMLQRRLRVGFARAGRLMDLLENEGVVGPSEGSKARAVLITPEQLDSHLG